ncbi:MAG: asparagine synthase-related protein [Patescibacteria group bacterium]|jgi:hypothetical protein|nr:asparagine synthase-related protein [Patescibacteria group bacterium]
MLEITDRFVAIFPKTKNDLHKITDDRLTNKIKTLGFKKSLLNNYFLAFDSKSSRQDEVEEKSGWLIDTFKGTKESHIDIENIEVLNWNDLHIFSENNIQFYNLIKWDSNSLEIQSDCLSHKYFYITKSKDLTFLASCLKDLLQIVPEAFDQSNPEGIIEYLNFGFFQGSNTLHKNIERSLPSKLYKWEVKSGLKKIQIKPLTIPQSNSSQTCDYFVELIGEAVKTSIVNRCNLETQHLTIGLSGGFDSRLLAGFCASENLKIKGYTYGNKLHSETSSACEIARTLGLEHQIIKYPENLIFDKVPIFLDVLEGHADLQVAQIFNLLSAPETCGTPLLHGYLGGPLSGHHIGVMNNADLQTKDGVAHTIYDHFSSSLMKTKSTCLGLKIEKDEIIQNIFESLDFSQKPYQAITKWELLNTQRDNIGSTLRILGSKYKVIAPLYDKKIIEIWQTLPLVALKNRFIFRELLKKYFPLLAEIPHSEEYYPILPNLKKMLLQYCKIKKAKIFNKSSMYANSDYIWTLSHGGFNNSQREFLLKGLLHMSESIQKVLGLEMEKDLYNILYQNGTVNRSGLDYLRRIYTLAVYSEWILNLKKSAIHLERD